MFKLVVLSALVAVAVAAPKPGVLHAAAAPGALAYGGPLVAHSAVIGSIPTSVSTSSSSIVHSAAVLTSPALQAAPTVSLAGPALHLGVPDISLPAPTAVRTIAAPALSPYTVADPAYATYAASAPSFAAGPALAAGPAFSTGPAYAAAPTFAAGPGVLSAGPGLGVYAAHGLLNAAPLSINGHSVY